MNEVFQRLFAEHGLITAFAAVGVIMWVSYTISKYLTFGRIHGSAIAIILGLILAYAGGIATGGRNGIADIPMFAGMALISELDRREPRGPAIMLHLASAVAAIHRSLAPMSAPLSRKWRHAWP